MAASGPPAFLIDEIGLTMMVGDAGGPGRNSTSSRASDRLMGRSGSVQRRRRKPRFDWLEDRRLAEHSVAEYPLRYLGCDRGHRGIFDADLGDGAIGSLASINPTTGISTQYNIPTPNSGPTAITLGPDKKSMWFLETTANQIGEINLATDAITEFPLLDTPNAGLSGITAGPTNQVWFTESSVNKIGMIDIQTGAISEFTLPGIDTQPEGITYAPDGYLWIAEAGANQIAAFNPTTHVAYDYAISGTNARYRRNYGRS